MVYIRNVRRALTILATLIILRPHVGTPSGPLKKHTFGTGVSAGVIFSGTIDESSRLHLIKKQDVNTQEEESECKII